MRSSLANRGAEPSRHARETVHFSINEKTALRGMHHYLYFVYCLTPSTPCAVTTHKTCTAQQGNGFQKSAHIQDQR